MELLGFDFEAKYRLGQRNVVADALYRDSLKSISKFGLNKVREAHKSLCHAGVDRLWEFIKSR